jgi:RNA polymerase sigma-70 factor, ECF subfamily
MTEPDDDDWSVWLARHGRAMLLFARQWAASGTDAEDVVQEAFLRFWRSRGRADDPAAYLYACVRHCALDLRRAGRRREDRERSAARPELTADWFTDVPERRDRVERIERGLRELPGPQREVVVLKVWGRLSFEQVGVALSIPANTAASRYRYALEKLRATLAEEQVP